MRYATIRTEFGTSVVRIDGDRALQLPFADVGTMLTTAPVEAATIEPTAEWALDAVDWAPLVVNPGKIICLGLNYAAHIRETGRELPTKPTLFAKFSESLIGARDAIQLPAESAKPDWEAELAIVIGRTVRRADPEAAVAAIAGFTICNDVTMRDWQRRTIEWLQGKTWERSTPLGPVLVTTDELGPRPDLVVRCEVNGELMQEARTSDLVCDPIDAVMYASTFVTLKPGDVISTGTPGGVGDARNPPRYLRPGDVVRTTIDGIGELVNPAETERG